MRATIENVINVTELNLDNFELKFGWMLFKQPSNYQHAYKLQFGETTFLPEFEKQANDDFHCRSEITKKTIKSPLYKKILDDTKIAAKKWFKDHEIYSGKDQVFYGDSPEAIKNDICFSKILPYLDPTKMEIIDLTK